ncbi:MAG: DUF4338 domain-containing protein [Gemmatimonadetes bacterium]|nr:DUF4338 domain-containing protein [Gemmatimonadota bacterium]
MPRVTWVRLDPPALKLPKARKIALECARALSRTGEARTAPMVAGIREEYIRRCGDLPDKVSPLASLYCHILCDLFGQGWAVRVERRRIELAPPVPEGSSPELRKAQVRAAHVLERDSQLLQAPTRRFIREMEQRRLHRGNWCSIYSVMRDGRDLAESLRQIAALPRGPVRDEALRRCVDPYVQVVDTNAVCEFTGLRLADMWRYFRHTWITPYFSTPGRKLWILIRDRAAPNHPVVGIGALGSAIVQLSPRDRWIGWSSEEFLARLRGDPSARWAKWLDRSLSKLIAGIYVRDFLADGVVSRAALCRPTDTDVERLRKLSVAERQLHYLYPKRHAHKGTAATGPMADWKAQAKSHLFRSKRAGMLALLLQARRQLLAAGFTKPVTSDLRRALDKRGAQDAIRTVLRHTKAAHVGVDVMDITVCGAIAPYNALLGGKLVALLMASPEVEGAYRARYESAQSVIASSMAGKPVRRRPNLVLLGTTSLYDVAPAQYNRLRVPAQLLGGSDGSELAYLPLGTTAGFGSYHFSRETMATLEWVLARQQRGRPVNSIFGEGVNPKLRKVRTALDLLGFPSDAVLQHRSPRVIYAVPLASNFREVLIGLTTRSQAILPAGPSGTVALIDYWRSRWLSGRIERFETLGAVEGHTLSFPVRHGARVTLPADPAEDPLFALGAEPAEGLTQANSDGQPPLPSPALYPVAPAIAS